MGKILALDIGEKRIGVAISDELLFLAHPLTTLQWKGFKTFFAELDTLIKENNVTELLIGVPYTLNGNISRKTADILNIIKKLKNRFMLDVGCNKGVYPVDGQVRDWLKSQLFH